MNLTEFLLARIAEDEEAARACSFDQAMGWFDWPPPGTEPLEDVRHIDRWDPARVLAECEAKRRIVEIHLVIRGERVLAVDSSGTDFGCGTCHCIDPINDGIVEALGWCETLRALALPGADHPDYDPAWQS